MSGFNKQQIEKELNHRITRVDVLGNHYQRNIRSIREFLPSLLRRLDREEVLPLFDFREVSPLCYEEMDLIRKFFPEREEAMNVLGCYYSLHLIGLNLRILEGMDRSGHFLPDPTTRYKEMLLLAERAFTRLYSALMRSFLEMLTESECNLPEFVICHVGARRDQDDIDVGIVHRPGGDLVALNRVIGRLNREMYRRGTPMHFYLSEHSGATWFSSSIDDYERLMDEELKNFVVISQLFGSIPITGSISLFNEFRSRVVMRYAYRRGKDNRYYEGFVRGVLEEIRSFGRHRPHAGEIVPKMDGLRLAKLMLAARRATLGIVGGQFWKAFNALQEEDPDYRKEYATLEEAIAFLESVRFLYQVIFVQEEGIRYTESFSRGALDRVARLMGYPEESAGDSLKRLLRDYFRYCKRIRAVSLVFQEEFKKSVDFIRVFHCLASPWPGSATPCRTGNLARDLIGVLERMGTSVSAEEFVSFLEEEKTFRRRFFTDLKRIGPGARRVLLERYFRFLSGTLMHTARFSLLLPEDTEFSGLDRLREEWAAILREKFVQSPERVDSFVRFFHAGDRRIPHFTRLLSESFVLDLLGHLLERGGRFTDPLISCTLIFFFHDHYRSPFLARKIKGLIGRGVIRKQDVFDTGRLRTASLNALRRSRGARTFREGYQSLADYHDLETLRFFPRGILAGRLPHANYTDRYLRRMIRLALREAGIAYQEGEGIGIYAAGGNVQEEGCVNDYDLFLILDPVLVNPALFRKAVLRMHRELSRLGIMPHHRIGEQIGCYAVSIEQLVEYLDRKGPGDFVDRAELLGSRLVFGDPELHSRFQEEVIRMRIFREKRRLIQALIGEYAAPRPSFPGERGVDLKYGPGGLFDITLLMNMLRAAYEIYEPRDIRLLQRIEKITSGSDADYALLVRARRFLSDLAGVLRLTVRSQQVHDVEGLRFPAFLMGYTDPARFSDEIIRQMAAVRRIGEGLINRLL